MKSISVFDTTISDFNLGNEIIMESIYGILREIFPDDFFYKLPFMEITRHTMDYISRSDLVIFGGTNSLSSRMERYKQWDINLYKSLYIRNVILMGLGWWQYQEKESLYTKVLLHRVLSRNRLHSVRDSYTENKLRGIGIVNVVNTGCPTLWRLLPEYCREIKTVKSDIVVMTLTDYNREPERDRRLIEVLLRCYRRVRLWVQGVGDREYLESLCPNRVEIIPPTLAALDAALSDADVDYVGTRLHAGIRALQKKRRTVIVAVDNRATEMKKDFGLPVIEIKEMADLESRVLGRVETEIRLPLDRINRWKEQFREAREPQGSRAASEPCGRRGE